MRGRSQQELSDRGWSRLVEEVLGHQLRALTINSLLMSFVSMFCAEFSAIKVGPLPSKFTFENIKT